MRDIGLKREPLIMFKDLLCDCWGFSVVHLSGEMVVEGINWVQLNDKEPSRTG